MPRSRFARTLILVALVLFTAGPALGATPAPPQAQSSLTIVDWFVDWFTGLDDAYKVVDRSIELSTDTEDDDTAFEPNQSFALPSGEFVQSDSEVSPQLDPNG